jgi:hypothetical protein
VCTSDVNGRVRRGSVATDGTCLQYCEGHSQLPRTAVTCSLDSALVACCPGLNETQPLL